MIPRLHIDPFDESFLADPYAHHEAHPMRVFPNTLGLMDEGRENLPGCAGAEFEAADRGECTEQEAERPVRSFISASLPVEVQAL